MFERCFFVNFIYCSYSFVRYDFLIFLYAILMFCFLWIFGMHTKRAARFQCSWLCVRATCFILFRRFPWYAFLSFDWVCLRVMQLLGIYWNVLRPTGGCLRAIFVTYIELFTFYRVDYLLNVCAFRNTRKRDFGISTLLSVFFISLRFWGESVSFSIVKLDFLSKYLSDLRWIV